MSAVAVILLDNIPGHFGDGFHMCMSVRFVSVSTCFLNEFRKHIPASLDGGGSHCCLV